jgi:hypothetical protein
LAIAKICEVSFRQELVKGFRGTRPAILETPPESDPLLPAGDAAVLNHEDRARAPHRHAILQGGIDHREDLQFGLSLEPLSGYRPDETPLVFFRRRVSSTAMSARARSFSNNSCLRASHSAEGTISAYLPGLALSRTSAPSFTCWRMRARSVKKRPFRNLRSDHNQLMAWQTNVRKDLFETLH